MVFANLAHPAEQHPRNVQVLGSSPRVGFFISIEINLLFFIKVILYKKNNRLKVKAKAILSTGFVTDYGFIIFYFLYLSSTRRFTIFSSAINGMVMCPLPE